jgi:hypothetical protein
MNFHRDYPSLSQVSNRVEETGDLLIAVALIAAVFGEGRARLPLIVAALTGWAMKLTGHFGIL